MNVFRLFLCLGGLVTFLAIRALSPTKPPETLPLQPEISLPAFPDATSTSTSRPTEATNLVESPASNPPPAKLPLVVFKN